MTQPWPVVIVGTVASLSMTQVVELLTAIIGLATALIGLYRTYRRWSRSESQ